MTQAIAAGASRRCGRPAGDADPRGELGLAGQPLLDLRQPDQDRSTAAVSCWNFADSARSRENPSRVALLDRIEQAPDRPAAF